MGPSGHLMVCHAFCMSQYTSPVFLFQADHDKQVKICNNTDVLASMGIWAFSTSRKDAMDQTEGALIGTSCRIGLLVIECA